MMWFKNLKIFRLSPYWKLNKVEFESLLQEKVFKRNAFSSGESVNTGFIPFFEEEGVLIHRIENHWLIKLMGEKKVIPASLVKKTLEEKVKEFEEGLGYKVGRKKLKKMKEEVELFLRAKALSTFYETRIWFDLDNRWMIVDTSSSNKSGEVIGLLAKILSAPFPIQSFMTERSPTSCMTSWLLDKEVSEHFTIDQNAELKSTTDSRISVRYANHSPEQEELLTQINSGKTCTKLALTWRDRISFILNDNGDIKHIKPLEVLITQTDANPDDFMEHFNAEMLLMFGELSALLDDLTQVLGGEKQLEN